jgi:hypothetical protein
MALTPGVYTLASLGITTALTDSAQTAIDDVAGMTAVTLEASFSYGSGGTTCIAYVQTTFDGGTTWRDIARFDFATATAVKVANLSGLLSKAIAAYAALSAEGVLDGVLGDRLRVKVTSTGTYVGSTLSVRASVR